MKLAGLHSPVQSGFFPQWNVFADSILIDLAL
jgi:hypothetical protein